MLKNFKNIFKKKSEEIEEWEHSEPINHKHSVIKIYSPMMGIVKPLSEIDDDVFSKKIMGDGFAIEPKSGRLISPINGTITALSKTSNSIEISSHGLKILIHIGIDTYELKGKHFTKFVSKEEKVETGQLLIEFDITGICLDGYPIITPVILKNSSRYKNITPLTFGEVEENQLLTTVKRL